MLEPIYRLNRWYDQLDAKQPNKRFLLFFLPMVLFQVLIYWPGWGVPNLLGLIGLGIFAMLRIIPIAIPRRQ